MEVHIKYGTYIHPHQNYSLSLVTKQTGNFHISTGNYAYVANLL